VSKLILSLQKNDQQQPIKNTKIKPFSHNAKAGWIEFDLKISGSDDINIYVDVK
jgi:hypothetical protein